jgi:outer membrane protein TolC
MRERNRGEFGQNRGVRRQTELSVQNAFVARASHEAFSQIIEGRLPMTPSEQTERSQLNLGRSGATAGELTGWARLVETFNAVWAQSGRFRAVSGLALGARILRSLPCWIVGLMMLASGCTRSVPTYLNESGAISSYLDRATKVDYPDVEVPSLDEVTQAQPPITVVDPDFHTYYDLTLEDAISYGLHNAKLIRGYGTPQFQNSRVLPGIDNIINSPNSAATMWNVAVRETEPGFIPTPGQINGPGSLLTNTGLDVNQGVESALADFDAYFASNLNFTKSDEPRNTVNTNPLSPLIFQQDQWNWQNEIGKKTAGGTQIFFRNSNTYLDNNNPLAPGGLQVLDSWYRTSFEAEMRQPLLRGRGEFINRMPIVVSRIGSDQEIALLESQLQNYLANIEIRYWDLYLAYRNLDAAKKGRDAALETWKIVDDQFREGAEVNVQQVSQAAQQYFNFNAQVTDAFNQVLNAQGQLRFLLGWSTSDGTILRPIDEPAMAQIEFSWCESLCEALTYRPELRSERWEIKKRELALAYAKNGLLPELNATALYRWLGLGNKFGTSNGSPNLFPDPTSGALNELFGGNYQEVVMGLDFRMPIGYRRELANVRNAQLKLARELGRLEDMELDATRELTEAFQALALNQQNLQNAWDRWRYIKIEEEHFRLLQDAGVERLDVALDAQQRLAQAEIQFYTSLTEYNKVIALIHRRKGTSLAYCGVEFSEGPWSGKAYLDAQEHARRRAASRQVNYGWTRPQVISQGEQAVSTDNIGFPFDARIEANSSPTAVNTAAPYVEEIEGEPAPAKQAPSFEQMPTPSNSPTPSKTRYRNQPTPASRQTGLIQGHHVTYEAAQVNYEEPAAAGTEESDVRETHQAAPKSGSAEPRRHVQSPLVRELPTNRLVDDQTSAGEKGKSNQPVSVNGRVILNTSTTTSQSSSASSAVDWKTMQRLGLQLESPSQKGNTAQIQIKGQ